MTRSAIQPATPPLNIASAIFKADPWSACAQLRAQQPAARVRVRVYTKMEQAYLSMFMIIWLWHNKGAGH